MVDKIIFSFSLEVGMDKRLVFYSILDFFPRRFEIKETYESLSLEDKRKYKMYVYSLCFEREYVKDLIWEYLNDWEESYPKFIQEYSIKRRKVKDVYNKNNLDNNNVDITSVSD